MNRIVITSFLWTTLVHFSSCQSDVKTSVKNDSIANKNKIDGVAISATPSPSKTDKNRAAIEGHYVASPLEDGGSTGSCPITVDIVKRQSVYFYTLTVDTTYKGKVSISKSEDGKDTYVTFEGITWAEYEGDVSNDSEEERAQKPAMKLPVGIDGQFKDHEITIQNYGNAMNYYVKLGGCGDKYIRLIKN